MYAPCHTYKNYLYNTEAENIIKWQGGSDGLEVVTWILCIHLMVISSSTMHIGIRLPGKNELKNQNDN